MGEECLGIDWGETRIGLALGNSAARLASPLAVVGSIEEIGKIISSERIDRLIVGRPMQDLGNEVSQAFLDFVKLLEKSIKLPILLIDERFSTQAADRLDPQARRRGNQDAIAAMLILQSYFDSL